MSFSPKIYFCSDDFGMTEKTCARILQCRENGCLNKISVLPNTRLEDMPNRLRQCRDMTLAVHINLVEGTCVSEREKLGLLVDDNGYFKNSFTGLLWLSLFGKRQALHAQVKQEMKAQIHRALSLFPEGTPIFLDSHQHTHMIPLIFKTLAEIIGEEHLAVSYIRMPAEPILPFLAVPSLFFQYFSVNLIKQWLLKGCGFINRPILKKLGIDDADFFGIMFSGNMTLQRVEKILPHYYNRAVKHKRNIEVLFHPGYTLAGEKVFDERKASFQKFYFSNGRKNEYDALHRLKTDSFIQ